MRDLAFFALKKLTPQSFRTRLKPRLQRWRMKQAWWYRLRYGTFTIEELTEHLRERLAEHDFEILMVHCSYNGLLPMYVGHGFYDGPARIAKALRSLCGPDRTLAMPAFNLRDDGRETLAMYREDPTFDLGRTPSRMGLVSEMFRRTRGVRRSLHPTHSVCALGPLADEIVADHHRGSACGEHSPFLVMARRKTVILGLGTPYYRSLTQAHTAEDLLGEDFPVDFPTQTVRVRLEGGSEVVDYDLTVHTPTPPMTADVLRELLDDDELVSWRWKGVDLYLVPRAGRVTDVLVEAARRGVTVYRS